MTTCMYVAKHCLASGIPGWVFPSIVVPWVLLIILITCQLIYMVKTKGICNNHYDNYAFMHLNEFFTHYVGEVDKKQQKSKIFHLNNCQVRMQFYAIHLL